MSRNHIQLRLWVATRRPRRNHQKQQPKKKHCRDWPFEAGDYGGLAGCLAGYGHMDVVFSHEVDFSWDSDHSKAICYLLSGIRCNITLVVVGSKLTTQKNGVPCCL